MLTLFSAALLLHGSEIPHVHPHDVGTALTVTLALAFVAGALHALLRRNRPA